MPIKVLESAAEFTAKWFTGLLSDDDQYIEIAVAELKSVGADSGMMSAVYRASLSYLRGSGPDILIFPKSKRTKPGIRAAWFSVQRSY